MSEKKTNKTFYLVKDLEEYDDDKWYIVGTKEQIKKHLFRVLDSSIQVRKVTKKDLKKFSGRKLYFVKFFRGNWAGVGGGGSNILSNMQEVRDWIIEQIKSWDVDIGTVKFEIWPVYYLGDESD